LIGAERRAGNHITADSALICEVKTETVKQLIKSRDPLLSTPSQRKGKELLKTGEKFEIRLASAEDGGGNARTQNGTESANG
ncbi:MAG: hypothetical protein ACRD5H_18865, partial [Nitrososphaerales archaeon]